MDAIIGILQAIGVFMAGLAARLGFVLLAMAVILVPALAIWAGLRGFEWLRRRAQGLELTGGLHFRPGLLYAAGHTWVRPEKGMARIGIDDLAQRILPWAVSVHLPQPGTSLRAGQPAAVISAGSQQAVITAPIDGTVTAVNGNAILAPDLVKSDNYARGWLFLMKPASDRFTGLRSGEEARRWLGSEGHRLYHWLEGRLGIAAADGGEIVDPVASYLAPADWKALTESFLR